MQDKMTLAWALLRIEFGVNISHNLGPDKAVEYIEINLQCKTVLWFQEFMKYEGWNFNSGNYLFTTDTK